MMNNLIVNRNMASLIKSAGMRPTRQRIMLAKLLFKDGELKSTKVGATPKSDIVSWIKENI